MHPLDNPDYYNDNPAWVVCLFDGSFRDCALVQRIPPRGALLLMVDMVSAPFTPALGTSSSFWAGETRLHNGSEDLQRVTSGCNICGEISHGSFFPNSFSLQSRACSRCDEEAQTSCCDAFLSLPCSLVSVYAHLR